MKRTIDPNNIYDEHIGQPFTDEVLASLPAGTRVHMPGYCHTMEVNRFRLNVHVDKDGIITSFTYG